MELSEGGEAVVVTLQDRASEMSAVDGSDGQRGGSSSAFDWCYRNLAAVVHSDEDSDGGDD
eukprot:1776329-Prymnesium_polylepis.1